MFNCSKAPITLTLLDNACFKPNVSFQMYLSSRVSHSVHSIKQFNCKCYYHGLSYKIYVFYNFWWTFLTCLITLSWCILWNVQTLQLYKVCSTEWSFMCLFRWFFWSNLLHSVQWIFALFWWTFLTCVDKLPFCIAW